MAAQIKSVGLEVIGPGQELSETFRHQRIPVAEEGSTLPEGRIGRLENLRMDRILTTTIPFQMRYEEASGLILEIGSC